MFATATRQGLLPNEPAIRIVRTINWSAYGMPRICGWFISSSFRKPGEIYPGLLAVSVNFGTALRLTLARYRIYPITGAVYQGEV
jgi:hypothetical protein